MRIHKNYEDPHHLNSSNGKKKKDKKDDEKDKKHEHGLEQDIILGDKDEDTKRKVQKKTINGHEWITFKNIDNSSDKG